MLPRSFRLAYWCCLLYNSRLAAVRLFFALDSLVTRVWLTPVWATMPRTGTGKCLPSFLYYSSHSRFRHSQSGRLEFLDIRMAIFELATILLLKPGIKEHKGAVRQENERSVREDILPMASKDSTHSCERSAVWTLELRIITKKRRRDCVWRLGVNSHWSR